MGNFKPWLLLQKESAQKKGTKAYEKQHTDKNIESGSGQFRSSASQKLQCVAAASGRVGLPEGCQGI